MFLCKKFRISPMLKHWLTFLLFCSATGLIAQTTLPKAPNLTDGQGRKHGTWVWAFDQQNPKPSPEAAYRSGQFKHGKPAGTFVDFDSAGHKLAEAKFLTVEENRIDGLQTWFSASGEINGLVWYKPDGLVPDIEKSLAYIRKKYSSKENAYLECLKTLTVWTAGHPFEIGIQEEIIGLIKLKEGEKSVSLSDEIILLGWMHMNRGQAEKALPLFQEGASIKEKALGNQHPDYLKSLTYIGAAHERAGQLKEAEKVYWQLANLWQNNDQSASFEYADMLADIALLYARQQKFSEADRLFHKVLELVPKESAVYEKSLFGLGSLAELLGNNTEALSHFEQVLALNRTRESLTLGYVWALRDVARLEAVTGKSDAAEKHLQEAFEFTKSFEGKGQLEHFRSIEDLAYFHQQSENWEKSETLWETLYALKKQYYGEFSAELLALQSTWLEFYLAQNNAAKSAEIARKMVQTSEQLFGPNSNETAQYLNQLGSLQHQVGQLKEAQNAYEKGLKIIQEVQGKEHTDQSNFLLGLGMISLQQEDMNMAESYFLTLVALNEKRYGTAHERTQNSLQYLINFYLISQQPQKAEEARKKLN